MKVLIFSLCAILPTLWGCGKRPVNEETRFEFRLAGRLLYSGKTSAKEAAFYQSQMNAVPETQTESSEDSTQIASGTAAEIGTYRISSFSSATIPSFSARSTATEPALSLTYVPQSFSAAHVAPSFTFVPRTDWQYGAGSCDIVSAIKAYINVVYRYSWAIEDSESTKGTTSSESSSSTISNTNKTSNEESNDNSFIGNDDLILSGILSEIPPSLYCVVAQTLNCVTNAFTATFADAAAAKSSSYDELIVANSNVQKCIATTGFGSFDASSESDVSESGASTSSSSKP